MTITLTQFHSNEKVLESYLLIQFLPVPLTLNFFTRTHKIYISHTYGTNDSTCSST